MKTKELEQPSAYPVRDINKDILDRLIDYQEELMALEAREKKLINLLKRIVCQNDEKNRQFREEILSLDTTFEQGVEQH